MKNYVKHVVKGGRLVGIIYQNKVSLFDFATRILVGEYQLFKDTDGRVSLSDDDRWLVIGSWNCGVKVFDLKNKASFTLPDAKSMTYLDILNKRNEVCCGSNKDSGFEIFSFDSKSIIASSVRYERIIEMPKRMEYLAFAFGEEKVFILNDAFEESWSWDWEAFALGSYCFNENWGVITGPSGELALMNLKERSVKLLDGSGYCFSFVAPEFMGDSILVLATDYKGGNESALLRLSRNLEVEELLGKYPPPIFDCVIVDGELLDRSGSVIEMASGKKLDEFDFE